MAWDKIPWAIESGPRNSPDAARLNVYLASGGHEGIVGPADLKVHASPVPDGNIRVDTGACVIVNRASGKKYQSYSGWMIDQDIVGAVTPTAGVGRSDLVIARVENPYLFGEAWDQPLDPEDPDWQFIRTRIIQGVPANTTNVAALGNTWSAITLARIDLPPSTATVQDSHITNLRTTINPIPGPQPPPVVPPPTGGGGGSGGGIICGTGWRGLILRFSDILGDLLDSSHTSFRDWPNVCTWSYTIPSEATHFDFSSILSGIKCELGDFEGEIILTMNGSTCFTRKFKINRPGNDCRDTVQCTGNAVFISTSLRGTTVTFKIRAKRTSGSGRLRCDDGTTHNMQLNFWCRSE